ncbi:OmpL47-type beta-barrel domain-containing protein [Bacillus benzoevorans]|uniref:Co-chaperonin GroES (HSP10) n=1 Tax=Bacillus benzoevorans TaxID=1456 RepID=A0A7X0HUX3_9BACI|nr:fibronectin type III domain-containing protein [Bacillus benzoevorans]MBB6447293.1 co-chaperonin GroES (HSP10) [Bacillus benzoevorans]
MRKLIIRKTTYLALLLLVLQVFLPFGSALAAEISILPPSNLAVQQVTAEAVKLTWSPVYGATGYNVYEIKEGQLNLLGKSTTTTYSLNNLAEGSYRYVVSTLSVEGESGPSAPITVEIVYPDLAAPTSLTYSVKNGNDIVLNWGASQYAQTYNLYQISTEGDKTLLTSGTSRTYMVSNAPEGKQTYSVSAVNSTYGESPLAAPVEVEIVYPTMTAPDNFTYSVANGNDITFKWGIVPYATNYKIYEIADGQSILKSTVTGTTVQIPNVPARDYVYEIRSNSDRFGESAEVSRLSVTVGAVTMAAPSNFTSKVQNINDIVLNWGSVPYATGYKVYQIIDGEKVFKSTVTGTTVTYPKVPGGNYVYEVYSYSDRFGESALGSKVSLTVENVAMEAPSDFTYKIQNGNDIVLSWGSVSNANSYKVYQIIDGEKVLKSTITGTTVTYTNMPAGDYAYEVYSYSDRFGESAEGSKVSLTIETITMTAPSNFEYKIQNGNDIALSWESTSNATNYKVYQIVNGQRVLKNTVTGTTVTYANMPEGDYKYEVFSFSTRFGESKEGSQLSFSLVHPTIKAPANLMQTIKSDTEFTLNWEASPYATSYKVYQIINGQKTLKSTVSGTTVTYTNMPSGEYTYVVHTYSSRFGESVEGTQLTFILNGKTLGAPTNPTYTITNGNDITLRWSAVQYATGYKIYQVVDGQKFLKNTVTGTSITYTNMLGGDYHYVVHSVSSLFGESPEGAEMELPLVLPSMEAPGNFTYKVQNGNDVVLNWEAVQYANSYKVYELVNGEKVLKTTVTSLAATLAKVAAGDHTYIVHSVSNRFGESPEGSKVSFSLNEQTMQAPENLTYSLTNVNYLTLKWDPVTFATAYKVYQIIDGDPVLKSTVTGTSVSFNSLPEGEYQYEVHSYSDRFGDSLEGSPLSFKLVFPIVQAPGNLTYKIQNENDVVFSWGSSEYANSYKVYELVDGEKVLKSTTSSLTATLTNVPAGDHTYIVHAVSTRFGESPEGSPLSFKLVFPTVQAPGNLTYKIQNGNDVVLNWEAVQYANSYKIYEIVDGEKVLIKTVTSLTGTIPKAPAGDHTYIVHAVSTRFGESPEGSQVSLKMNEYNLEAPGNLTYKIQNGNDVVLNWESVEYANSYKVYEIVDEQKVLKSTVSPLTATLSNVPAGDHTYIVHAVSTRFGESQDGSEVSFKLVHPTMQAPENLIYSFTNVNNLTLKWNAATYATSYKVYQIVDGEPVLKNTVTGTSVTFSNIAEGNYKYVVRSVSTRFGESPEGSQVDFELIYPTMQAPANPTQSITNGNDITLRWDAATYATAYKVYQIMDGQPVLKKSQTGRSVTFTNMPEGDYTYQIHSYSDRFGESPKGSELNFNLTWPVVPQPELTGAVFNANNITLSWKAVPWGNEYRLYKLKDGNKELIYKGTALSSKVYNLTEDTHSFEVTAYNNRFGESKPSNPVTEKIVYPIMQPPTASLKLLSDTSALIIWDFVTYANGYNIYEMIADKPVLLAEKVNNLSYTVSNLSYADHEYFVTSFSNSFGESAPSSNVIAKLIIDTEAPFTTTDTSTEWTNQNPVVTLSAMDNETGVANTYYSLNDSDFIEGTSFTVEEEGVHKVSFYSVDKVGNKESIQTIYIKVDQTAPVTNISDTPSGFTQPVTLKLDSTDAQSGVKKTFYSINGSEYEEGTSFTVDKEGINQVSYYSTDQAGNIEKAQMLEVKIDKMTPTTTSDAPKTWSKENVTVKLTATDGGSGVAKTYYSINGSDYEEGTSITVEKEGVNQVSYYSIDQAGNIETAQTTEVKIDKTAPVTASDAPEAWSKENVTVKLTATDRESGIANTFYSINGSDYVQGMSFIVDKEGVNQVSYYSIDQAGNREKAQTTEVKIDKTAPVTASDAPEAWSKEDVTVKLTATDRESGVAKTFYSINGAEYQEGTSFTVDKEGVNEISFYSIDQEGNIEKAQTIEVKIDKTAPILTIDLKDEYKLGSSFQLQYSSNDDFSGIVSEEMTVLGPNETTGKMIANGTALTLDKPGIYHVNVSATNGAGIMTTIQKQFVVYIPAAIEVTPKVIKGNNGVFTVRADLTEGYNSEDFNLNTVKLNGVNVLTSNKGYYNQAKNGQFKFERSDFTWTSSEVMVEFRGYLKGYLVVGQTTVKVQK